MSDFFNFPAWAAEKLSAPLEKSAPAPMPVVNLDGQRIDLEVKSALVDAEITQEKEEAEDREAISQGLKPRRGRPSGSKNRETR